MEDECHLPFTTEILARQYGMTPRCLNRVFKEHTGQRVMDYLVSLRMKRARYILENSADARVRDVAASLGYQDSQYFSRLFKRETGYSPKDIQKHRS